MESGGSSEVAQWVRLCRVDEAPAAGKVTEAEVEGVGICLANLNGELSALDNICPHRQGPLGQGWLEGEAVVCPWHSWTFNARTGESEYPAHERVDVFPVRVEGDDVLVDIETHANDGVEVNADVSSNSRCEETLIIMPGYRR